MTARGFRSIGRQWVEVTSDTPAHESLTYFVEDDDRPDELATRRGRRPGRPIALDSAYTGDEK